MKFLVCIDGSEHSAKIIQKAAKYANAFDAEVTLLYVLEEVLRTPLYAAQFTEETLVGIENDLKETAKEMITKWEKMFHNKNVTVKTKIAKTLGSPANAICEVAKEDNYDLLIVGNRGLGGLKKFFLGSVSLKVANDCHIDVMIVK